METNKFFVLVDEKDLEAAAFIRRLDLAHFMQHLKRRFLRLTGLDSLDPSRDVELGWFGSRGRWKLTSDTTS